MPSMNVVEFFQDEVQFPYGVIKRVSAPVGTPFSSLHSLSFPRKPPPLFNLYLVPVAQSKQSQVNVGVTSVWQVQPKSGS